MDPDIIRDTCLRNADLRNANLKGRDLRNLDMTEADLTGANLCGADLTGTEMRRADLRGANLTESRLVRTDLRRAELSSSNVDRADMTGALLAGAELTGASFMKANLSWADFHWADLSGANLVGAKLIGASIIRARLRRTNFSRAILGDTMFAGLDLSKTVGIADCIHIGPCFVSTDTLLSSGVLPDSFLRGCGLPDKLIKHISSYSTDAIEFYSCFISYSHADKHFARRLHDQLQAKGVRCWLDEKEILPGENIYEEVDRGLKAYDKVLLCASKDSLNSWWVERELKQAFEREMNLRKERETNVLSIIPLNLDGHLFAWDNPHGPSLRERLAPDFTKGEGDYDAKFTEQLELVIRALRADTGRKERPPDPKL